MILELSLFILLSILTLSSIIVIEERLRSCLINKVTRYMLLFFIITIAGIANISVWNHAKYKIEFLENGTFFTTSVLAKLSDKKKDKPTYRLLAQEPTDTRDPVFYKKPGIQAILVEEDYNWVIKFIDPFAKDENDVISAAVVTVFVDKSANGKIFGTELNVDIYIVYNQKTDRYDKLTAFVSKSVQNNTDIIMSCSLDKLINQDESNINIIARGPCFSFEAKHY